MKVVRLSELRELLQGAPFAAWWTDWSRAAAAVRDAAARHVELVAESELMDLRSELAQRAAIDTLSKAGEAEAEEGKTAAEAQGLENRALELVGHHEEQRLRTSDLWYRLGGAERTIEERRAAIAAAGGAPKEGAKARAHARTALEVAEKQHRSLQQEYAAEDQKRSKLWEEVEGAWERSFEQSLHAAEHGLRSRKNRRDAGRLFNEAEERRARAKQRRVEADAAARELTGATQRRVELLAAAQELGCVPGEAFLYWRHHEDKRAAFAVALADDPEGTNLAVKALAIYTVGRARGVGCLEPAREGVALTVEEGDRRFEENLVGPRIGVRREPPPAAARGKP